MASGGGGGRGSQKERFKLEAATPAWKDSVYL